ELLLRLGVDTEVRNKRGDTALLRAIKLGNEEVWTALLSTEKRANINAGDDVHPTALHYLAFEGGLKTIKKLVEHHEADVNARGGLYDTPLQAAATGGFRQTVRYLLDNGADPTLTGGIFGHALSAAAFSG
ncbi:ankyrin, partial [Cadophora sp. DSE1049]